MLTIPVWRGELMEQVRAFLLMASRRADLVLATIFVFVTLMLIIPMPTWLMDVLIALNLVGSLLVLITSTYLSRSIQLSTLPSIILLSTVFRLALGVSTARLILAKGDAGHIVASFGKFVVAGNVVVGLVVFAIIALVQFLVITKGSERIAEVSARFMLDSLPGKQMSIDGDVRSGDITKEEARFRRDALAAESQFFGAMDGAMKFVKGDAIAAIVIVLINLIGGLLIGMIQRGNSFNEAIGLYALLSVGDGLISQIPAMFISLAAGNVVTRVALDKDSDLASDIGRQLFVDPRALGVASALSLVLGFLPGFPKVVFILLSVGLGVAAYMLYQRSELARRVAEAPTGPMPAEAGESGEPPPPPVVLPRFKKSDVYVVRANPRTTLAWAHGNLPQALAERMAPLYEMVGFHLPMIGFNPDPGMNPGDYVFEVDGVPVGFATSESIEADAQQMTAWKREFAASAFGIVTAKLMIADIEESIELMGKEFGEAITPVRLVELVRLLLEDEIYPRPTRLFVETVLRHAATVPDTEELAGRVRLSFARQIAFQRSRRQQFVPLAVLGPGMSALLENIARTVPPGEPLNFANQDVARIMTPLEQGVAEARAQDENASLLVDSRLRATLRRALRFGNIRCSITTHEELSSEFPVRAVTIINAADDEQADAGSAAA
jgi:type III secretion protein V